MGSFMGKRHRREATSMTIRAAGAVAACICVLVAVGLLFSMPLLLVLPVYFAAELLFAIIWYYRYLLLSYQPVKYRPLSHDPISAFERAMAHLQQFADIRHFLSIWFHGAQWEDIKRDNVADLLAYAFWYKTRDEIAAEGRAHELEAMVQFIEHAWGVELTPGHNPKLRWMCHLWEPMRCWYQPLGFYLFMELAGLLGSVALRAAGFKESWWCGLAYYTKNMPQHGGAAAAAGAHQHESMHAQRRQQYKLHGEAAGAAGQAGGAGNAGSTGAGSTEDVPLVLLHGIGMGLIPYIGMLFNMAATGRPLIALQFKHVSMRWVLWVPTVDEVAEVLVGILRREGVGRCCLVAHSYGTAVASRLLQQHPEKVDVVQTCMIDPVCFTMFMPSLLRNFLYESPNSGSWLGDFMMLCAARDLHVSATLSRRFFWTDVNLWEEQLPASSLVVLSGQDVLMAAAEVKAWLELRTDAVVMFHPQLRHAGFLLDIPWQQQILQQLLPLLDSKLEVQQQQHPLRVPPCGLQARQHGHGVIQAALRREADSCNLPCVSAAAVAIAGGHVSSEVATVYLHSEQQQLHSALSNSCGTSCSGHSSFEFTGLAASSVEAATGLPRDSSSSSHSSALASRPHTASSMGSIRTAVSVDDCSSSQCDSPVAAAAVAAPIHRSDGRRSGSFELHTCSSRLASCTNSAGGGGCTVIRRHTANAALQPQHQHQQHQFVGVDSDGCVVARVLCPPNLAPAGDSGYFGAGMGGTCTSLHQPSDNSASCDDMLSTGSLGVSPFASTLRQHEEGKQEEQHRLQLHRTPLEGWTGVTASAPVSCSSDAPSDGSSVCSAAAELESPRTFFSGCSSQSWQDLAALAAAKDAATAAQILLQPVQAWQQQRREKQQERQLQKQQQAIKQQQSARWDGSVTAASEMQAASSKRDSMLRRVEVLLHRRQNKHGHC